MFIWNDNSLFFVNTLTLLLTFFTFVGYTILYTVILKHLTHKI